MCIRDRLWDKLVPLYFPASPGGGLTFHRLYEEWLDYKQTLTGSPNTCLLYTSRPMLMMAFSTRSFVQLQ